MPERFQLGQVRQGLQAHQFSGGNQQNKMETDQLNQLFGQSASCIVQQEQSHSVSHSHSHSQQHLLQQQQAQESLEKRKKSR